MHECTEIELLYNSNYFSQHSYNENQLHNEHQVAMVEKLIKKNSFICISTVAMVVTWKKNNP